LLYQLLITLIVPDFFDLAAPFSSFEQGFEGFPC